MRLFEILDVKPDPGPIGNILKVLQGQANNATKKGDTLVYDFDTIKRMAGSDQYGISNIDTLIQWQNEFDPNGNLIKDIDVENEKVYIKTKNQANSPAMPTDQSGSTTVDNMASRAAKKAISSKI
jgi:hypothetical protein